MVEAVELYGMLKVDPAPGLPSSFVGTPVPGPYGRIFGGQLIGQATMAASATTDPKRNAHSLHAYFARAGDANRPVVYEIENVRDGRSFSLRSVRAHQDGRLLLTANLSFHEPRVGLEHQDELAGLYPDPEDLDADNDAFASSRPTTQGAEHRRSIELRRVPHELDPASPGRHAGQALWIRARHGDGQHSQAVHHAALALSSDFTILESVLRGHGLDLSTHGLTLASLDHSIWWHAPANLDAWILYVQESPWAAGERGLVRGRLYDRNRKLVATVMQEGLVRVKRDSGHG